MHRIGFVGLGVMGAPMAGHLVSKGHEVVVWNRTAAKCDPLRVQGARVAESLEELGGQCGAVFLCVGRTEDVEECLSRLVQAAVPGTTFVDHSTISPSGAARIHCELASQGFAFLDAPVTGGSMGAQKGTLTVFCGGGEETFTQVEPVMRAYGKNIAHVGGPGAGQMTKMANQIAVGGSLLALCESLAFAKKAGLDVEITRSLLASGAAGSWAFENYGPKIVAQDWSPGFSVKNQRKDFGYCMEAAREIGAALPGTALTDLLLAALQDRGGGESATAALYDVLLEMSEGG